VLLERGRCSSGAAGRALPSTSPKQFGIADLFTRRLGTVLLERGRYSEAEPLVMPAEQRFAAALGADNPVRGEATFAAALLRLFQLLPFQVG